MKWRQILFEEGGEGEEVAEGGGGEEQEVAEEN